MLKLLIGHRGSGKTKRLVDLTNEAAASSKGNVVCVEKGDKLKFDINRSVRLVNIDEYSIEGFDAFYGFLCGLCAGNYDITDILIDATRKIGGYGVPELAVFLGKLSKLAEGSKISFTLTVSADREELPADVETFAEIL
jgi:hypothetical protein